MEAEGRRSEKGIQRDRCWNGGVERTEEGTPEIELYGMKCVQWRWWCSDRVCVDGMEGE